MNLQFDKAFNNGSCFKYKAFDNQNSVGFSQIRRIPSCSDEYPTQCKSHIYYEIDKKYRGKGLGKVLLRLTIEEARKIGVEDIKVSCLENNIPSLKVIKQLNLKYINSYKSKSSQDSLLVFSV